MIKQFKDCCIKLKQLPCEKNELCRIGLEIYFNRRQNIRIKTDLFWYKKHFEGLPVARFENDLEYNKLMIDFNKEIDELTYHIWTYERTKEATIAYLRELIFGKPAEPQKNVAQGFWEFVQAEFAVQKLHLSEGSIYVTKQLLKELEAAFPELSFESLEKTPQNDWLVALHRHFPKKVHLFHALQTFKFYTKKAQKAKHIANSELFEIQLKKPKPIPKKLIAKEEFEVLKAWFANPNSRLNRAEREWVRMFLFSVHTRGLRKSDCLKLKRKDVEGDILRIVTQKDQKVIEYKLHPYCLEVLRVLEKELEQHLFFEEVKIHANISPQIGRKIGFSVKFHDSRRYFATLVSQQSNSNVWVVAEALQVSTATAERYVKTNKEKINACLEAIEF